MKRPELIFCLVVMFAAFAGRSIAQGPYFKRIDLPNALDELEVECVAQCNDGFMWLGTTQGLFRYDGIDFIPAGHPADSLNGHVTALAASRGDTLWVGYATGRIGRSVGGEPLFFEPEEGHPRQRISDMLVDSEGRLWYATYGEGIYVYNGRRVYNIDADDGLSDNFVYSLAFDPDGNVWAGTDRGISICSFQAGEFRVERLSSADGLPDDIVTSLHLLNDSVMIAGMYEKGICGIDPSARDVDTFLLGESWSDGVVRDLISSGREIWIVTNGKRIVHVVPGHPGYVRRYGTGSGAPDGGFLKIDRDDEGNIWILSKGPGLTKMNPVFEIVRDHEQLSFRNIHALMTDHSGHLWFFNDEGLIRHSVRFTGRNTVRRYELPLRPDMHVISLYEDDLGFVWAGTFGEGAYRIDPVSGEFLRVSVQNGLVDDNVLGITGADGEIWFATLGGVSHIGERAVVPGRDLPFQTINDKDGLGNNYVYSVLPASDGSVWFATDGNGAVRLRDGEFSSYSQRSGHLKSDVVYSIAEDRSGNIWFSTLKAGVYRYNGSEFHQFRPGEGLRGAHITSLVAGPDDQLFIAHRDGIDIYHIPSGEFSYYAGEYGLQDIDPDLNTASVDANGDIWLGTNSALIKYSRPPDGLRERPRTVLSTPLVFLESHDFGRSRHLKAARNHITFRYNGLWFQNPEVVTYRYRLTNYDPQWVYTRDRTVIYPNLPTGKYEFHVQSSASSRFEHADTESFSFSIRPPFWKSWWFLLLSGACLAGLLYLVISARERQFRQKEKREREHLLLELENLKSQVNPHFLFNSFNSLMDVIENDPGMAVEYVEKLSQFFRNILMYRDEELIPLRDELRIMEDYFFIHQQRYDHRVTMELDIAENLLDYRIPPLTLQILIENAVKHNVISAEQPLRIVIRHEGPFLIVRNLIARKRHAEASTGTGLRNITRRYRILTGREITIQNGPEFFTVRIPLIKNEDHENTDH